MDDINIISALKAEINEKEEIIALQQRNITSSDELVRLKERINVLKDDQIRLKDAEIDQLQAQVNAKKERSSVASVKALKAEIEVLKKSLEAAKASGTFHYEKSNSLNDALESSKANMKKLKKRNDMLVQKMAEQVEAVKKFMTAENRVAKISVELSKYQKSDDLREVTKANEDLKAKITALEAQVAELLTPAIDMPLSTILDKATEFKVALISKKPNCRPRRTVVFSTEALQFEYVGKARKLRSKMEDAVRSTSRVKSMFQALPNDFNWIIEAHDYVCEILHCHWDNTGDMEWMDVALRTADFLLMNF